MKQRVKALMLFKEGNFQKQEDLVFHLCIGYSTNTILINIMVNAYWKYTITCLIRA